MKHIKEIIERNIKNTSKAKFYQGNKDIFLKYFDSVQQYDALIRAGNFKKMEAIIAEGTSFKSSEFIKQIEGK